MVAARDTTNKDGKPQHTGLGRRLMDHAELLARRRGYRKIAVIAGVGVRNYYRKLGYELRGDGQYLIKQLPPKEPTSAKDQIVSTMKDRRTQALVGLGLGVLALGAMQ